jgi:hypothetical protein
MCNQFDAHELIFQMAADLASACARLLDALQSSKKGVAARSIDRFSQLFLDSDMDLDADDATTLLVGTPQKPGLMHSVSCLSHHAACTDSDSDEAPLLPEGRWSR